MIGVDNKLINSGDFDVEEFQKRGYVINSWVVNNMSDKERLKKLKVAITTDCKLFRYFTYICIVLFD